MATRGRKSQAAMMVQQVLVAQEGRLNPPVHLTDAERFIWLTVVNDHAADAFSETHVHLLECYCRHMVTSRVLADVVLNFDLTELQGKEGLEKYDKLLKMHERETRSASMFATRLRITRQAIDQQTIARAQLKHKSKSKVTKPWEQQEPLEHEDQSN